MSLGEAFGLAAGLAALHVDDLAAANGDHHRVAAPRLSVVIGEARRANDLVVAESGEVEVVDPPAASP